MREILAELLDALERGHECVYCSLAETRGSTPQKAGAAMLVFPDGSQRGTLGGGCVEAEVKQRALQLLTAKRHRPEQLTFCLDDDYGWDDGLICGGRMSLLAEPILSDGSPEANRRQDQARYFGRLHDLVQGGRGCTEAVSLGGQRNICSVGTRFLFDHDGNVVDTLFPVGAEEDSSALMSEIAGHLIPVRQRPRPATWQGIAYLPILPRVTLFIVGAGHVGQAVARLAGEVDFDVWVLDDRERYANAERFPNARRLIVGDIGVTLGAMAKKEIDDSVYCLVMTRGHSHDEEALFHVAASAAGYVGMIGSKRKIKMIFEDLVAKGISEDRLANVHAPLGLAIGSQTVPEIAVSIVAELIACRNLCGADERQGLSPPTSM